MKTAFVRAMLACGFFSILVTQASASPPPADFGTPPSGELASLLTGVTVVIRKFPRGPIVMRATTGGGGRVALKGLEAGRYELSLDGPSLIAAMDKLAPSTSKPKGGGSSLSLGGGGFLGRGSRHSSSSHEGAGPAAGRPPRGDARSSGSETGIGANFDVAPTLVAQAQKGVIISLALPDRTRFSSEALYCRDAAGQGPRIWFSIPVASNSGDADIALFWRPAEAIARQ